MSALPADPQLWKVIPRVTHEGLQDALNRLVEDGYAVEELIPVGETTDDRPTVTIVAIRADVDAEDGD